MRTRRLTVRPGDVWVSVTSPGVDVGADWHRYPAVLFVLGVEPRQWGRPARVRGVLREPEGDAPDEVEIRRDRLRRDWRHATDAEAHEARLGRWPFVVDLNDLRRFRGDLPWGFCVESRRREARPRYCMARSGLMKRR